MLIGSQINLKNGNVRKLTNVEKVIADHDRFIISFKNSAEQFNLLYNNVVSVVLVSNSVSKEYMDKIPMRDISVISTFADGTEIPVEISNVFVEDDDKFAYTFGAYSVAGENEAVITAIYPKVNLLGFSVLEVKEPKIKKAQTTQAVEDGNENSPVEDGNKSLL